MNCPDLLLCLPIKIFLKRIIDKEIAKNEICTQIFLKQVIQGGYFASFWTKNLEFADIKSTFGCEKLPILAYVNKLFTNTKPVNNE